MLSGGRPPTPRRRTAEAPHWRADWGLAYPRFQISGLCAGEIGEKGARGPFSHRPGILMRHEVEPRLQAQCRRGGDLRCCWRRRCGRGVGCTSDGNGGSRQSRPEREFRDGRSGRPPHSSLFRPVTQRRSAAGPSSPHRCTPTPVVAVSTSRRSTTSTRKTGSTPSTSPAAPAFPGGSTRTSRTTPGEKYSLTFWSGVNGAESPGKKHTMAVSLNGSSLDTVKAVSVGLPVNWVENT